MKNLLIKSVLFLSFLFTPLFANASEVDGATLSLLWGIPFVGILLSIALFPLFLPQIWHAHFGKITAGWALAFLLPFGFAFGFSVTTEVVAHAMLAEYIPFIILLLSLFTVSGGIFVKGNLHGSAKLNTGLLLLGTILASLMGTTGAAMLLIRPLIRANDNRKHKVHVIIFFIFLVANIGGGLTPLGDPPLFLGFLKGVDFFWTLEHMLMPVALTSAILLVVFFLLDSYYYSKENEVEKPDPSPDSRIQILGKSNFLLLLCVVGGVLLSGFWKPGISFTILGTDVELQNIVRDLLLLGIAVVSMLTTSKAIREDNQFNWEPILEVGKLFAGIFVTIAPVIAILRAGLDGHMAPLVSMVSDSNNMPVDSMYFWMTGVLSSFLDNAPTYLVFFNLASGDALHLMNDLAPTLLAISMGSVFMGAMTYIGNAPNFMVSSIAFQAGIKMPSFFGYMKWSVCFLVPIFLLLTFIFF